MLAPGWPGARDEAAGGVCRDPGVSGSLAFAIGCGPPASLYCGVVLGSSNLQETAVEPAVGRSGSRDTFETVNAQTPPKTGHHPGPEDKASQQDQQPSEICKTSIPGSNPGGASNFSVQIRSFVRAPHKRRLVNCLESPCDGDAHWAQVADSVRVAYAANGRGRGSQDLRQLRGCAQFGDSWRPSVVAAS
jgi:hypothetical protein